MHYAQSFASFVKKKQMKTNCIYIITTAFMHLGGGSDNKIQKKRKKK